MIKFGDSQLDYQWHTPASAVDKPFEKSDMCDVNETAPAGLAGWFQPSQMNTAILEDLVPGKTYYYRYGSDEGGWSGERVFTAAPAFPSPERRTVIAAFGDMGNVELDGSLHHSWDFNDEGEVPSLNTSRALFADKDAEMVLHIGDISYACGFLSEWNNFFYQIEPVASTKAWMPGIGNHEQGFSGSYFPGTDSGGECGVPYNAYFPYASQNPDSKFQERQPWYDFTFGSVHFVVFSTEHDFTEGSPQYEWLEKTLANVDRKKTPWLVVGGHRPMYVSTEDQWRVADPILRAQLESMFAKYKVDVALWGHNHSYQRTCSIYNMTCVDGTSQHGIVHLVIGAAGYVLNPVVEGYAPMKVIDNSTYGYLHMDFQNSTVLKASFIDNSDGSVVDDFTVVRED